MSEYEILRLIWWAVLGVLLIGFAVMDGFDLGTAMLLPFVARTDLERRVVINTVGPVWEGNQVWLITGGGAIFAAWPALYAVAFSGFYLAMFLLLAALILRPVGFKFRSKIEHPRWRASWDIVLFLAGLVPALVFGVAFGNAMLGAPFRFTASLRMIYTGGLLDLFSPFALLCGLVSVAMLLTHGASWLACKTEAPIAARARRIGAVAAVATLLLFALGGLFAAHLDGYVIAKFAGVDAPSNPLTKQVARVPGALLAHYARRPVTLAAPILGLAGAALAALLLAGGKATKLAFLCSAAAIAGIIATAGISLFPFLLPSSLDPNAGLTVWDASSSAGTLLIMAVVTAVLLPIILAYTSFIYHVLRGKVTAAAIEADPHGNY